MTALTREVFTAAVTAATLAPSMHNTQPWLFRRDGDTVEVYADTGRDLTVADPHHRAVRISCGAALLNLRLALTAHGHPMTVRLLPEPGRTDFLARLTPAVDRPATPLERELHAAIGLRHSNRDPYLDSPVSTEQRARLTHAAATERCWLQLVDDPAAVARIAAILRRANRRITDDPGYQVELAAWINHDPARRDGVPVRAGGPAPAAHELLPRRDFGGPAHPTGRDYQAEPLLAVLGAHGDLPGDQLRAGQALQRVLLTATVMGLSASMMSQPVDDEAARDELWRELHWQGSPHMLLRLGYGLPATASPRRPAADVILP
ncbi:nitroreductase [Longispora sp. NPDC051575]|uniref:Acg family FMN-binding oxidoreductase n=1 Tax=Longispora sp. NPDC051575 TaxID=3154943 RepID=UPI003447E633